MQEKMITTADPKAPALHEMIEFIKIELINIAMMSDKDGDPYFDAKAAMLRAIHDRLASPSALAASEGMPTPEGKKMLIEHLWKAVRGEPCNALIVQAAIGDLVNFYATPAPAKTAEEWFHDILMARKLAKADEYVWHENYRARVISIIQRIQSDAIASVTWKGPA